MKIHLAASIAAISMLVGSASLLAGELPFDKPDTHHTQEKVQLRHPAAPDWTSKIGTGSAADLNSGTKAPAALLVRAGSMVAARSRP